MFTYTNFLIAIFAIVITSVVDDCRRNIHLDGLLNYIKITNVVNKQLQFELHFHIKRKKDNYP